MRSYIGTLACVVCVIACIFSCDLFGQVFPPSGGGGGAGGSYSTQSTAFTATPTYLAPGGSASSATESAVQGAASISGNVAKFSANLGTAPGAGKTIKFTWRKATPPGAAADQTVTCTVSGTATSCSDTTNSFTYAPGDLIDVSAVTTGGTVTTTVVMGWGLPGVAGPAGPAGAKGDTGATGPAGSNGTNGAGYGGTSTTNLTVPTLGNTAAFVTQSTLAWQSLDPIRATCVTDSGATYAEGIVVNYNVILTHLNLLVQRGVVGNSCANWTFGPAAGPTGPAGPTGSGGGLSACTFATLSGSSPCVCSDCQPTSTTNDTCIGNGTTWIATPVGGTWRCR